MSSLKELHLINIGPLGAKVDYSVATNLEILEVRDFDEAKFEEYYEMSQMELGWFSIWCWIHQLEYYIENQFQAMNMACLPTGRKLQLLKLKSLSLSNIHFYAGNQGPWRFNLPELREVDLGPYIHREYPTDRPVSSCFSPQLVLVSELNIFRVKTGFILLCQRYWQQNSELSEELDCRFHSKRTF